MPEFHRAVGIPRTAAVEYPFGRLLGEPEDAAGQRAVLDKAIKMFESAKKAGEIWHLPFTWPEAPKDTNWHPPEISPIIKKNLDTIKKMKV